MSKAIICQGDTTTHGGTVLEGDPIVQIVGRSIARKGDKVHCPKCHNKVYVIVEGDENMSIGHRLAALEGMKTSCGATLISRQSIAHTV